MRGKHFFLLLMVLSLFSVLSSQEGGFKVVAKTKEGQVLNLYKASFALVIGVSDYASGWPVLPQAVKEAEEVGNYLAERGFLVTHLSNPTKTQLVLALDAFVYGPGQDPDNCLIIYFAGHGHTEKSGDGQDRGYLVPADAPRPQSDKPRFLQKALSLKTVAGFAQNMKARHALFLFDSCFSGAVFDVLQAEPAVLGADTENPVRQFLTAGGADEPRPERSLFKGQLLEGLKGGADLDKDGYVTGTELAKFLQERVTGLSQNSQHPQYGLIRDPNLNRGDFVFSQPQSIPRGAGPSVYVKMKTHAEASSTGGESSAPVDVIQEEWITEDRYASLGPDQAFIIDLNKNVAIFVSHKSKSYVETSLPLDIKRILPPDLEVYADMMQFAASVTPTSETMKIGQWNCKAYDIRLKIMAFEMHMKVWTTTEVPFDVDAFNAKIFPNIIARQMRLDDQSRQEMKKIKGYQVAAELNGSIMSAKIRTTSEVLEISKRNPPANVFIPPADYTKKDMLSLEDVSRR